MYEPGEAAIIRYVRAYARSATITDALYSELATYYSVKQMIEICFTAGLSTMIAKFHATFLTELDPQTQEALASYCPLPIPQRPT